MKAEKRLRLIGGGGRRARPETAVSMSEDDGAGFYEVDYGPPILQFKAPNRSIRRKVRALLDELPIEPFNQPTVSVYDPQCAHASGCLDSILEVLFEDIESDFHDNAAREADWPGGFDYIVVDSVFVPGGQEVLTRYFYDDGPGEMYYGRVVQRIAREEYLLWLTD